MRINQNWRAAKSSHKLYQTCTELYRQKPRFIIVDIELRALFRMPIFGGEIEIWRKSTDSEGESACPKSSLLFTSQLNCNRLFRKRMVFFYYFFTLRPQYEIVVRVAAIFSSPNAYKSTYLHIR